MPPTNGSASSKTSSTPAASTLRPRTRRLISVDDELGPVTGSTGAASPWGSRATSPIPSSHLPRAGLTPNAPSSPRGPRAQAPKALRDTSAALSGIWGNSWSAIQGLATNVLGNETEAADSGRRRKPLSKTHRRTASSVPPKQWGPSASPGAKIGVGSQGERESLVRALKRKDLLTANEHLLPDSVGRVKRRNSDDRTSASAPPGENEDRDALVYIHKVQPSDTLAGITIRFNCQPTVLRRANRMWPNDSVQVKDTLVLPVDACGVKGRPVAGPNADKDEHLLVGGEDADNGGENSPSLPVGWSTSKQGSEDHPTSTSLHSNADTEPPWRHDSWVVLPNDTTPTEIGRMPRRALGFFPPARRKSLAFSDATTPPPSFDLPRSSTSTNHTNSLANSPNQTAGKGRVMSRTDSLSGPQGRHRSTSNSFRLHGPGGVGTMGRNVRSPGPAQDGLNKLFASHLPNVAPPPDQEYFTPWAPSLLDADSGTYSQLGSGARTPLSGAGLDLQEIGGAIEGWMRKVGTQASKLLSEPSTPGHGKRSAVPVLGSVGGDIGDLIELRDDAFEIGDGGEEERGRSRVEAAVQSTTQQYQSSRPDITLTLRDRGRKSGNNSKDD
ncbi:carbohydrate-binding module family 50 protein [Lophiostoma macrostomum CBS 122681]|uniref:Carbohydrate-binding module family 50 protein n=1 Tax=Lophiostoma macrostomum CBS 122681 TaxID=1314788 RepID=A0A6A6TU20_9PLEO|nr:carbohydrate-binding module family 50 protein [Lophiostoma macrostomum CBS 122681]